MSKNNIRGNYDEASQKPSSKLPTLFEIYGDLKTLCDYDHVYIRYSGHEKPDVTNSIADKILDIINNVLPSQHITGTGYVWEGRDSKMVRGDMDALMTLYEDFEDVAKALDRLKTVVGNEAWKETIQKLYTPEKIDERQKKLTEGLLNQERRMIVVTKDQYSKSDAQKIKASLRRTPQEFQVFNIANH